jgi:hypothetical protein
MNEIPPDVEHIYNDWNWYRRVWWFLHYLIGIAGMMASLTVANKPQFLQDAPLFLNAIAWLSALCVGLLVFLEPRKRARAYTTAWRVLHKRIGEYRHGTEPGSKTNLLEGISQGEEFIAKLDG